MAFKLQVSNSLKILADQVCTDLKLPQYSVFQPNYIVTQTEGMNNWLKLQIAENIGIAPGPMFTASKSRYRNCIRLSCGYPWSSKIERSLMRIGELADLKGRSGG